MSSARNALANATNPSALIAQPVAPIAPIATLISTRAGLVLRLSDVGVDVEISGIGTVVGGAGHDIVTLSDDNTIPVSVSRVEEVHGSAGIDTVQLGNFGNDVSIGGVENIIGGRGYDRVTLLEGDTIDTSVRLSDVEYVRGSTGFDTLHLSDSPNSVKVYGVEQVFGGNSDDYLSVDTLGGLLDDIFADKSVAAKQTGLYGGDGNDTLEGGNGADILVGGDGVNTIYAGDKDTVYTGSGYDTLYLGGGEVLVMVEESLLDGVIDGVQIYRNPRTDMMEVWGEFGDAPLFTFSAVGGDVSLRVVGLGGSALDQTFLYNAGEDAWM